MLMVDLGQQRLLTQSLLSYEIQDDNEPFEMDGFLDVCMLVCACMAVIFLSVCVVFVICVTHLSSGP